MCRQTGAATSRQKTARCKCMPADKINNREKSVYSRLDIARGHVLHAKDRESSRMTISHRQLFIDAKVKCFYPHRGL